MANKKINVGIGIPHPDSINPDFSLDNLPKIIGYTKKYCENVNLFIHHAGGVRTDRNRNTMLKDFLNQDMDYILWLDCDMIYPVDIIETYLKARPFDVLGCLYFKRNPPHKPIGYLYSKNPSKPYTGVLPSDIKHNKVYDVDGIGYGGMMVNTKVYKKLPEDEKWTHYGYRFHQPDATDDNLSHDLTFCKAVKDAGMSVKLHGSVRPGHIGQILVTEDDYYREHDELVTSKIVNPPKILIVIPTLNEKKAINVQRIAQKRAGIEAKAIIVVDKKKSGYVKTMNKVVNQIKDVDYYVYLADDVIVGENWLYFAIQEIKKRDSGLCSFKDGKWNGQLASYGLVSRDYIENLPYDGNLFCSKYKSHYCDTELTQIAKRDKKYCYSKNSLVMEVDYYKPFGKHGVNLEDKKLYNKRKYKLFDKELAEEFA